MLRLRLHRPLCLHSSSPRGAHLSANPCRLVGRPGCVHCQRLLGASGAGQRRAVAADRHDGLHQHVLVQRRISADRRHKHHVPGQRHLERGCSRVQWTRVVQCAPGSVMRGDEGRQQRHCQRHLLAAAAGRQRQRTVPDLLRLRHGRRCVRVCGRCVCVTV
jgi:hypothetical protein